MGVGADVGTDVGTGTGRELGLGVGMGVGQFSSQAVEQVYTDSSAQLAASYVDPVVVGLENPWVTVGVGESHVSRVLSQFSS